MKTAEEAGLIVRPGKARINIIDVQIDAENFLAVEIDMHSKYVEPVLASSLYAPSEVLLYASERALYLDDNAAQTVIYLPARTSGWEVVASGGRYTIQIAAWKRPDAELADN